MGLGRGVGGGGTGGIGLAVAVWCSWGLERGQHPGGHGGAGEAPQDQHHHQQKREAATHLPMIRRAKGWFPCARTFLLPAALAELRKQAAAAREAAQSGSTKLPGLGPDVASIGGATSSTFSAGGALALGFGGGGGGPQERMVKAAEATTKKLDVLHQDVVSLKDKLAGLVQRAT